MKKILLNIKNLNAFIGKKQIIKNFDLLIRESEIHVIMGPNGSGKSSISKILAGHPSYKINSDLLLFNENKLLEFTPEIRSHQGLFIGFQYPIEIPGLTNFEFLRVIYNEKEKQLKKNIIGPIDFMHIIQPILSELKISEEFLNRSLNHEFSGGEKKRNEILQMILLKPKLSILDEIDSGLDIDTMSIIVNSIKANNKNKSALIVISHYPLFIRLLKPTFIHVMLNGCIVKKGKLELLDYIERNGFKEVAQK